MKIFFILVVGSLNMLLVAHDLRANEQDIKLPSGNAITIVRHQSGGNTSLLWLPSEHGLTEGNRKLSSQLSRLGIEVWLVDLFNSYFLIPATSSIDKIPVEDITLLVNKFLSSEKKQKIVLASGRSAVILLRALKTSRLADGVILVSPNLYTATPEPGSKATYLPITSQTKQKIVILQPQQSPWYWQRETQTKILVSGGSQVVVNVLPGVRDRFYFRPDASAAEKSLQAEFPKMLVNIIKTFK